MKLTSVYTSNMDLRCSENGSPFTSHTAASSSTNSSSTISSIGTAITSKDNLTETNTHSGLTCVINQPVGNKLNPTDEDLREWNHKYHMRTLNLLNFPTNASSNRVNCRTVMNRARIGIVTSSAKSLNVLRQALQNSINNEINNILQKYVEKYFRPSMSNMKKTFGANSVSEQHLQAACRQILEEAKKMYIGSNLNTIATANSPLNGELLENGSDYENSSISNETKRRRHHHAQVNQLLAFESDSESNSLNNHHLRPPPLKRKKLKVTTVGKVKSTGGPSNKVHIRGNPAFDIKREGPRWDPNRLSTSTKFVLGSKANKALGFGATRGRLYTKHADLFRYIGDQEDKQWLHEHGLMPPAGGKAYLIIKEDIEDLLSSEEYRGAPGVDGDSMGVGFTVPNYMIQKMRQTMESMRDESARVRSLNHELNKMNSSPIPLNIPESSPSGQNGEDVGSSDVASNYSNNPLVDGESREPSPTVDLDYLNSNVISTANQSPFSSLMPTDSSPNPESSLS